jgi:hypothetical protein
MTSCFRYPRSAHFRLKLTSRLRKSTEHPNLLTNSALLTSPYPLFARFSKMSWMDSWSRPNKHATTPPPLYLTVGDSVPYCHSCGRVIGERRKHGTTEVKYCSARCRNSKPGPIDRKIEAAFAALLNGASPESLKEGTEAEEQAKPTTDSKDSKDGKKSKKKGAKTIKGDHRILVECQTVQDAVFNREKDPEKVYGRRKNRKARFVVEKPEDWRSVDMVDDSNTNPAAPATQSPNTQQRHTSLTSSDDNANDTFSDSEPEEEQEGGVVLEDSKPPNDASQSALVPDQVEYGYGSGKVRPPQAQNDVNGSVGGHESQTARGPAAR